MPQVIRRYTTDVGSRSTNSRHSDDSQDSSSTAPTSLHSSPRPSIQHAATEYKQDLSPSASHYPRSSTETYASTVASQEELCEEPDTYDPEYEVPEYRDVVETSLRPSNPSDFADYFPSTKRLFIRHDNTTYDGNMNLRVDTEDRKKRAVQLFHMRMHDLKKREFSLRRYERQSGREVCHSSRKYTKSAAEKRPAITRSMSNAFASIGKPSFKRTNSGLSQHSQRSKKDIKRQDSGYGSHEEDDDFEDYEKKSNSIPIPTNTTKLEFSNYAQVDVKRRGAKSSKRYEFEYWGYKYTWKRVSKKDGEGKEVSYHLYKGDGVNAVAHIVPDLRSPSQVREGQRNGEWVPPCSMWISDPSVVEAVTDVADVIVATGLIALIDDCIKSHFHPRTKHTHSVSVPLTPLKYEVEFVSPKVMVDLFKRRNSGSSHKEREQRGSPLRYTNPVEAY
ncbi:hypothetical protein L207DRAFT_434614 [Hyaloscypha variabilis F]|jgi:hypothetical protein|uniref:Uncharacterized protein n=1 Tax=Hyaloscypha variabilis (strain UAMH 11265 / GT02V1 / F) TaxID=1149755 RepID=A0A2J6RC93_HYAVF|nr:hypothetical protein L207DRAFT_434614 [Hyaloscypha variabilis F]